MCAYPCDDYVRKDECDFWDMQECSDLRKYDGIDDYDTQED